MKQIEVKEASFAYMQDDDANRIALNGVSLEIEQGDYIAILGPNGSGKSTLAKLLNNIELPTKGDVFVFGINTKNEDGFWDIRSKCACVFQNPDNQIVGTTVEEDIAFGPENLGIPNPELRQIVDASMKYVGLEKYATKQTANLSGGQKQKLAIAGALAMNPSIIIMDESTSMLDPNSRDEVLTLVEKLRHEKQITVITITHDMYEASRCDRVYVMYHGEIKKVGKPSSIFLERDKMLELGLDCPSHINLAHRIAKITHSKLTQEDLVSEETCAKRIIEMVKNAEFDDVKSYLKPDKNIQEVEPSKTIMQIENLSYSYDGDFKAIEDVSLDVREGEILAIIGQSGCGKTTLITHLNALIRPQEGSVTLICSNMNLSTAEKKHIKLLRQEVGLVFQYPEYQLFEETVYKDVAFGIKKMKLEPEEERRRVLEAIKLVGLKEDILEGSPFELSGGQKRRVALAGVLVMRPKVLVLDEPASGLDPRGRQGMLRIIESLKATGVTIILVSHYMDEVAEHADRICCMKDGKVIMLGSSTEIFEDIDKVEQMGIKVSRLNMFMRLMLKYNSSINPNVRSVEDAVRQLINTKGVELC